MTDVVLDDWQEEVLAHEGPFVLCTGRQNGKTFIMSRKIAKYMREHAGARIIVVSLTEDQAKLIIVMTLDYLEKTGKDVAKGKNKPTQNRIVLKNHSQVIARPVGNTGDAIRGFTGDVLVIDECSRMPELAIEAGRPTLFSTGGQIWMCSTPFGKRGYFYESFCNKNGRFKVWHINSEQVAQNRPISHSWTEKQRVAALQHLEEEKQSKSKTYYGQEYLALFIDDLQQWFEDDIITKCCTGKRGAMPGQMFLGCDIARLGGDETTYEIIAKHENKYYHVESIAMTKTLTTEVVRKIVELDKMYNFVQIGIDAGAGSMGVGVFDFLREVQGMKRKVVAMNNRALVTDRDGKAKQRMQNEDFYDNLKAMMEKGEIRLLDDEKVRLSLKSIQWEFTAGDEDTEMGKVSKVRIFGKYSHIAEGLIRAAWLAKHAKGLNFNIYYI